MTASEAENCIFCRIARGEIPSTIVYQDDELLAFRDIAPAAPTHILLIPRAHIASIGAADESQAALMGRMVLAAARIARDEKLDENGYRLVTNVGKHGGQSVHHLHFHLLGGRFMSWPPG